MNRSNKGFTLIELLVVIAIIGVLSSIVLASLNTARGKGADAAIKGNLEGIRVQAEMVYDTNGCYTESTTAGTPCTGVLVTAATCATTLVANTIFKEPTVNSAILAASKAFGGTTQASSFCAQAVNSGVWAVATPLKGVSGKSWCVDSTGASRQVGVTDATTVTGGACAVAG